MRKIVFLLASVLLFARENPFLPKVDINNPSPIEEVKEFSKLAFNFPDDSRILNQVKFIYTSVDGSKKEYLLNINERIDWHDVYMLLNAKELTKRAETVTKAPLNDEDKIKKVLDEEYTKEEQKAKKELEKKEEPKIEVVAKKESTFKPLEYYLGNNFSVIVDKNVVIVKTYNQLIRQFTLNKPDRIVFDFKINYVLKNMIYNLNNDYIKQIYTGVHKDFYRVVIRLDGKYSYKLEKGKNEYKIRLN